MTNLLTLAHESVHKGLIRGQPPMHADHFVGSGIGPFEPPPARNDILHELSFVPQSLDLIVVRLRLFAGLDMPTHYAVVGGHRS